MPQNAIVAVIFASLVLALLSVALKFVPVGLWITAVATGVDGVNATSLIGMRLRRVPQDRIILPLIAASKAGLPITLDQLETHYLAGGNVDQVVNALISAHRAQIPLTFVQAAAIDLAGKNVLEAIQMAVNPKVIDTPVVTGMARDGGEVKAFARLTVRADPGRILTSDGEDMLLIRVHQAILTRLISSDTQWELKEKPGLIASAIIDAACDRENSLEIVSVEAFTV